MDMRFRDNSTQGNNRFTAPQNGTNKNSLDQGWDKYARKTINPASQPKQENKQTVKEKFNQKQNQLKRDTIMKDKTIKKYYRSDGAAPKAQFKQYLSDINNVFYQQRQSLRLLHLYNYLKRFSGILFLILLVIAIGLHFINKYEGECPKNATCGVFVHCFQGFQYDSVQNKCKVSQDFYQKIQSYCADRINEARQQWGESQCNNEYYDEPKSIKLTQLYEDISNWDMRTQIKRKLEDFLEEVQNQKRLHFTYNRNYQQITPIDKKYSLGCRIKLILKNKNFRLGLPISILVFIILLIVFLVVRKRITAKRIYQQLRKRTFAQKDRLLNISYAKADMQNQFGHIDQKMWELIDEYRSTDRDIGFLQDDFLYWKVL